MTYKDDILNERGKTHGNFEDTARCSQALKCIVMGNSKGKLSDAQQEALDMFCLKISRICTGNPNEPDHWRDIAGYANLIYEQLSAPLTKLAAENTIFDDVTARTGERLELRRAEVASYRGPDKVSFADPYGGPTG